MQAGLDRKRILVYLGFAFGIAWLVALVIYQTGGIANSPVLVRGTGPGSSRLTLAFVLVSLGYMWAPALGNILTRVVTREGWSNTGLRPQFRRGWRYWLAAWFLPGLLALLGGAIFYLLSPQYFSTAKIVSLSGIENPWAMVAIQVALLMLYIPVVNGFFTFGEEFGWRGYLLPRLMPLGGKKTMLLMGLIWGVWHWPLIAMGLNYGNNYAGFPWLGMLAVVWMTTGLGTFLGWVTLRSGSVWPAVIGHAAINGIGSVTLLFLNGEPNPLIGPSVAGLVGSLGFAVVALALLLNPSALAPDPR